MTKDNEAFFGMVLKVKNFGFKNAAALTAVPAVASLFTQLGSFITKLITADVGSQADLSGFALSKQKKREALEKLGNKVSKALASYAVINDDLVLQKKADTPSSDWYKYSEETLITQATIMHQLASPLAASLADYGVTAAEVTALEAAIPAFINVVSDPTLAIDQRKQDNATVETVIGDIRQFLTNKLDVVMGSFEVDHAALYNLYKSARAIDVNGSVLSPTAVVDVPANTITTIYTASAYTADTLYTIENKGSKAVSFSLSTTTNAMGSTEIALPAGETRSRLAENLASAGTFLVVNNTNAEAITVRLWVE